MALSKAEAARLNGKKGGRPRKPRETSAPAPVSAATETHTTDKPTVHPLLAKCTARERKFILALVATPTNQTKAYETAFTAKGDSARANAAKCLAKDRVRKAYEALSGQVLAAEQDDAIADAIERRRILTFWARKKKNPVAAIKSVDVMNKMDGVYIQKHEHSGAVQVVASPADERL